VEEGPKGREESCAGLKGNGGELENGRNYLDGRLRQNTIILYKRRDMSRRCDFEHRYADYSASYHFGGFLLLFSFASSLGAQMSKAEACDGGVDAG